jgi:FSR family fosmidomycin resistance protein-like MFS transporter
MASRATSLESNLSSGKADRTAFNVLAAISFCHLLNDMVQSLIPALYPVLKSVFHLDFAQIGLITLTNQITASLLQPVIGLYTDRKPKPFSLAFGMGFTLLGLLLLAIAPTYAILLIAGAVVGLGSAVFHPESSRVARIASGGQYGLAQSLFQVGGNAGSALGPLLAAFIVVPRGQHSVAYFSAAALIGIALLSKIGVWYKRKLVAKTKSAVTRATHPELSKRKIGLSIAILIALIFSKYFYLSSLTTYYTFYLIQKFGVSVTNSQILLFVFLGSVAAGTIIGGPIGDRIGRKYVIWASIAGVLPFTLILPYANLFWTVILTVIIGVILASAFSAILVYAQDLMPGNVGMISGLFFGFAFGMGGLGAAVLGKIADHTNILFVYKIWYVLPMIGLLTAFQPDIGSRKRA